MPITPSTSTRQLFIAGLVLILVYTAPILVGVTGATLFYDGMCPYRDAPKPCSFWEYALGGDYGMTFLLTWYLVPIAATVFGWFAGAMLLRARITSATYYLIGRLVCAGIIGLVGLIATVVRVK